MKIKLPTKNLVLAKAGIQLKTNRGFTILETMVAIFILTLSITGPMVFAQSGLRASFLARDQITAFYLAQDIVETIKNIRDENGLSGNDWLKDIDVCNTPGAPCTIYIDTTDGNPIATRCSGGVCPPLDFDGAGRYSYTGSLDDETRFTRTTYVREILDDQEAQIVVEVEWESNVRVGRTRILVQENIYNWIPTI